MGHMEKSEIIKDFEETGALLHGHFLLRSGLHSDSYFQAALLLQHTLIAAKLCAALAESFKDMSIETVISPAIGGIIVGQEVGRALGVKAVFAEKDQWEDPLWGMAADRVKEIQDPSRGSVLRLHEYDSTDGRCKTVLADISGQGHECREHTCEHAWQFMSQFHR